MIPCQRHLFSIPLDTAYLNCAYTSPLLKSAALAGKEAVAAKTAPWAITPADFFEALETVRAFFARIIVAPPGCVAVIPAVSYGIALAARTLPVEKGSAIVVLADQFPSNIYSWRRKAAENQADIITVKRPADGDWTRVLLTAIDRQTAVVAIPNCHWTDGTLIDVDQIGEKCRATGAALVIDGTQSLGAMPFSVPRTRPDFLITTAHKWLLGPYSYGFCYVDERWQGHLPLEENWMNRAGSEDFSRLVDYRDDYQEGARRFDVGAASNFILSPIVAAALQQIIEWDVAGVAAALSVKVDAIAARAEAMGWSVPQPQVRSPHLVGLRSPGGLAKGIGERLAAEKVFVSIRGDSIRVSPHLYTTDDDLERLFAVLEKNSA